MRIAFGGNLTVTATDRWYTEIRAGRAFVFHGTLGPSAGNNSHIQLFNPAASGVIVIPVYCAARVSVEGPAFISQHNVQLATDVGAGVNLLSGGAASAAHLRSNNNAGVLGTTIERLYLLANTWVTVLENWHMEMDAGEGILFAPNNVNVQVDITFRWIEL